jgi:DNA-binding LacI/PurR family transcriptional regulator
MPRSSRVTLEAISRELNLSTSSVSRALRNDPLIHPQTRAAVNTMAMRMGYQGRSRRGPQVAARQRTLGVLFANSSLTDVKRHAITMSYLQGMTSEASAAEVTLNVHAAPDSLLATEHPPVIDQKSPIDAWLVCGVHESAPIVSLAKTAPIISLVHNYPGLSHDLVSTEDFTGIAKLVAKLAALGHRRCVYVTLSRDKEYLRLRAGGFLEGARYAGLDLARQRVVEDGFGDWKLENPRPILDAIKAGATAVVTDSDHAAYEVAEALAREGIRVPRDVSITGFNAIGEPGKKSLEFTSYDPNFVEMGRAAVRLAKWRLENPSAAFLQVTVRGRVVEGASVGPAPASVSPSSGGKKIRPVRK